MLRSGKSVTTNNGNGAKSSLPQSTSDDMAFNTNHASTYHHTQNVSADAVIDPSIGFGKYLKNAKSTTGKFSQPTRVGMALEQTEITVNAAPPIKI